MAVSITQSIYNTKQRSDLESWFYTTVAKQSAAVSCVCTLRAVCVACSTCVLVLCVSYLTAAAATFLDVFKRNYLDALPRHALVTMISFSHKICVPLMLHALCYATNAAQCAHAPPCALRITTARGCGYTHTHNHLDPF